MPSSIRHSRVPTPQAAAHPKGRTGKGVFTALAWFGGVSLGYYLLCALGYGLYRLLQWAF